MKKTGCKSCKGPSWHMALCFAPILLFIALKLFFPQFAYLALIALLICPISIGLMMLTMNKDNTKNRLKPYMSKNRE